MGTAWGVMAVAMAGLMMSSVGEVAGKPIDKVFVVWANHLDIG